MPNLDLDEWTWEKTNYPSKCQIVSRQKMVGYEYLTVRGVPSVNSRVSGAEECYELAGSDSLLDHARSAARDILHFAFCMYSWFFIIERSLYDL